MGIVDMILQRMYGLSPAGAHDSRGPLGKLLDVDPGHYNKSTGDISLDPPSAGGHPMDEVPSPYPGQRQAEFDRLANKNVRIKDLLPNIQHPLPFGAGVKSTELPTDPLVNYGGTFKGQGIQKLQKPLSVPATGAFSGNDQSSMFPAEADISTIGTPLPIDAEPLNVPTKFGAGVPTLYSQPMPSAKSHNLAAMIFNRLRGQ